MSRLERAKYFAKHFEPRNSQLPTSSGNRKPNPFPMALTPTAKKKWSLEEGRLWVGFSEGGTEWHSEQLECMGRLISTSLFQS